MLTLQSLLLAAVCLSSRAATLETLARTGGDDEDAAPSLLKDRTDAVTRTHSVDSLSNSSLLTLSSHTDKTAQTSVQHGREEEEAVGTHKVDGYTTESLPWPPTMSLSADLQRADTLQLDASDEDRADAITRTTSDSLTSGDPSGPRLLDAADTWTEAAHLRAEDAGTLPSSQEVGTEATMSSEDLPLIFEPFEDVTPPSEVSVTTAPAAVTAGDKELMLAMGAEHTSFDVRLLGTVDCLMPETRASVTESHLSEEQSDGVTRSSVSAIRAPPSDLESKGDGITQSSVSAFRTSPSEDQESKEEPEEDEEDEEMDSDEEEEESEEDLMERTMAPHTRPPYSLIPPPPVWVQRNQGLVRSWVELIREKAGYVSGMLAPVGIGIAGALLLVGALYSIRLIHRKRRDSFKHQRRKQPREVRSSPDNAMLLADSSEDEF